ncbi:MAG TPA: hypothetical protein ENJ33_07600 [Thiothrix sp.]|nr:hypothetical protein [Thiothrix sp.]
MLILNGTKAFAVLMQDLLVDPPSKLIKDDVVTNMQWVLHVVKLLDKNCVVAMEVNTRYSMIFTDISEVDSELFVKRFIVRLVTEMCIMFDLSFENIQSYVDDFVEQHPQVLLCQRGDRSVQSHINDVVWHLSTQVEKTGKLPTDINELINLGVFVNQLLRTTKQIKDYFYPYEMMRNQWEAAFPTFVVEKKEPDFDVEAFMAEREGQIVSVMSYNKTTLH